MSTLWIAVIVLAAPPGEETSLAQVTSPPATVAEEPLVPLRTGPELRDAVREAMRRWARPGDKEADLAARDFLVLYEELRHDGNLSRAQREQFSTKVRGRLLKLAQQIKKRVAVQKRLAKTKRPESVDFPGGRADVLAQRGGFGRGGFGGGFGGPGFGGPMMGGPMMGGAGGPGTMNDDHGEALVELIQQTIAPSTWDVNGGPGSIYYWRPGRAIVVRQRGDVHDQIADVLRQMGKMGR